MSDQVLTRDQRVYLIIEPGAAGMTALRLSLSPPALGSAQAVLRLRGTIMDATALDVDLVSDTAQLPPGPAGTIKIGSVTTGAPGSAVQVANSGSASAAVLDLTIPAGHDGAAPTVTQIGQAVASYLQANPPAAGTAATLAIGKVTTLAAGASATVVNSGTSGAAKLDVGIPAGAPGAPAASLLATVALIDRAAVAVSIGVRSVAITGVTGLKAGDGVVLVPVAALPAGYLIASAVATADGVLTVTIYGPALAIGTATTIAVRVYRLTA